MNTQSKLKIGCFRTCTPRWFNLDNSVSIRLAGYSALVWLLKKIGLLRPAQLENIKFNRIHEIIPCDAREKIPFSNGSVAAIYSSHMVEHLAPSEARALLLEAKRVLMTGGVIRPAVPNLRGHVEDYLKSGDADRFMRETLLGRYLPQTVFARIKVFFLGERMNHVWMYDEASAVKLLESVGFQSAVSLPPGETLMADLGALNLSERSPQSLFVEGKKE